MNAGLGSIVPSGLIELYLVARFHGLFSSLLKAGWSDKELSNDLNIMKNAWANPSIIKN